MPIIRCLFTLMLLLPVCAALAQADELSDKRERLESVREQIANLEDKLSARHQRVRGLDAELAKLEEQVSVAARAVHQRDKRITDQRTRLETLEQRRAATRERLAGQRRYLAEQVRAAWRAGDAPFLRLLLSQKHPDRVDRLAVYYRYFNEARMQRIQQATDALAALAVLRDQVNATLEKLKRLRVERKARRALLEKRRDEREVLRRKLQARIKAGDNRLVRLRGDESKLNDLVSDLRERLARLRERQHANPGSQPSPPVGGANWPVRGKLIAQYGSERLGELRWSGVLIAADSGTPVHAVAAGEVVFSDWLRGVGLLIIIDHGNGRLSLYGHNQALYREAGDQVAAGEVIAGVGASGGQRRSALYFEVRVNGDPVDPVAWLEKRDTRG